MPNLFEANHMDYLMNFPEQLMSAMTFTGEHIMNIVALMLCMTFGYLLYTVAGQVYKKEKIDVYPVYLHCWMITIDTIGTITMWYLAFTHHFFWVFVLFGIGLPIWVFMEAQSIYRTIKSPAARQQNFGKTSKEPVGEKQALFYCLGMIFASFFLNNFALDLLGGYANCAIFIVWPFTNYVFAIWTWRWWTERSVETGGTRKYQSMKLHWVIVIQITLMWFPGLSWYLAICPFLRTPWYYLGGIAMTVIAVYNLYRCSKLPKRPTLEDGTTKAIW